jgi:protoporphyrinogen oxidase
VAAGDPLKRREFIAGLATAAWMAGCSRSDGAAPLPPGELLGASHAAGHRLRGGGFPEPAETRSHRVVIVGGGIAGLAAAWRLGKAGFSDFRVLELEREPGGNARFGANEVSPYPWGAHYISLPTREATHTRELLADLGVLIGDPRAARPRYEERFLCHDPQERLYRNGRWQDGLLPEIGAGESDRQQYRRFEELMAQFKARRARDGRKAFAIPTAASAPEPDLVELDRISMREFLLSRGLDSAPLHWHVNYACRDDFGTDYAQTSAWAGVHYFASHDAEAENADSHTVLTWPEGNGWVVRQLATRLAVQLVAGATVFRIREEGRRVAVDYHSLAEDRTVRINAERVIFAAPMFLLPYVLENAPTDIVDAARAFQYAPWVVANLTLKAVPADRGGAPLSWDNVIYDSPGLGYVVATHQALRTAPGPTVLTYYRPLTDMAPAAARERLLTATREEWAGRVLDDLARPHPDIRSLATRLDVFRWGHAMVRPVPGFMWGKARATLAGPRGRVHFAHSDLSGMSLFEEATFRGAAAAEAVLRML